MPVRVSLVCLLAAVSLPAFTRAKESDSFFLSANCSGIVNMVDSNGNGLLDLRSEFTAALQTAAVHQNLTCMTFGSNYTAQVAEIAYSELLQIATNSSSNASYSDMACQSLDSVLRETCLWPRTTEGIITSNVTIDIENGTTVNVTESPTSVPTASPSSAPTSAPTRTKPDKVVPDKDAPSKTNSTGGNDGSLTPSNGSSNATIGNGTTNGSTTSQEAETDDRYRHRAIILGVTAGALILLLLVLLAWKPCCGLVEKGSTDKEDGMEDVLGSHSFPDPEIQEHECLDEDEEHLYSARRVALEPTDAESGRFDSDDEDDEDLFVTATPKEPQVMGRGEIMLGNRSFQVVIQEAAEE